jgi:hypothetical protein
MLTYRHQFCNLFPFYFPFSLHSRSSWYFDLSRAFGPVSHTLFLHRLSTLFGSSVCCRNWFPQCLTNRQSQELRAATHQLRQDKHQDMRQKLTSASWLRPVCGGYHNLIRFSCAPFFASCRRHRVLTVTYLDACRCAAYLSLEFDHHLLKDSPVFLKDVFWGLCLSLCLLLTYVMQLTALHICFFIIISKFTAPFTAIMISVYFSQCTANCMYEIQHQ